MKVIGRLNRSDSHVYYVNGTCGGAMALDSEYRSLSAWMQNRKSGPSSKFLTHISQ